MEAIAAISTAQGRGGIAVVRISGDDALPIARRMFSRRGDFTPNVMYPGRIDCGGFEDFGLCVWFRAPRSFTGEDVVEFHCHGGAQIAQGVLKRTLALGARPAERGEFTRRAYLNGKLSLSAVEGLGEMIAAESQAQVRAGFALYDEQLTRMTEEMQEELLSCLASVDADVDFPEEELNAGSREEIARRLTFVISKMEELLRKYRTGRKICQGVNVVLCGRPNAGKSSLFNALLGYDRAIVSAQAGTTRDTVEATLELSGVLFRLIDTAGIRGAEGEIEEEGIRRAERALAGADLILWLKGEEPIQLPAGIPVITVGAKCDVQHVEGCELYVSAKTGEGLGNLKALLFERGCGGETDGVFLLRERHFAAVSDALADAKRALGAVQEGLPAELYAQDIAESCFSLGTLSGKNVSEAVVDEIFSHFCVGK